MYVFDSKAVLIYERSVSFLKHIGMRNGQAGEMIVL